MTTAHQKVTDEQTILPSQPEMRECFEGNEEFFFAALYQTIHKFSGLDKNTEGIELKQAQGFSTELFASNPMVLRFLQMLVLLKQPQKILEIGTFIGRATIYMAKVLPENAKIVTMEKYDYFCDVARQNFVNNGVDSKIHLIEGDSLANLANMNSSETFDMIFLDGNKEKYIEYFKILDARLENDGLFVVDDVLFHGDALNEKPKTEKGQGVKNFLEFVKDREDYYKMMLPIKNGMMLMYKKN